MRASPVRIAATLLALVVVALASVWALQAAGYPPCELCLAERWPYYLGVPLAAVTLAAAARGRGARLGFALLAALFVFSAGFGAYHAGVEWGLWAGPSGCTGAVTRAQTPADFMNQLQSVHVVRCDAAALRILGLSLAGWNAVLSLALAALALSGARRA